MSEKIENEVKAFDENDVIKRKYENSYRVDVKLDIDDETEEVCTVYLTKPKMPSLQRYLKGVSKDAINASKLFVLDNIVDESRENFELNIERYPALGTTIANKMLEMLGFSQNVILKKLQTMQSLK